VVIAGRLVGSGLIDHDPLAGRHLVEVQELRDEKKHASDQGNCSGNLEAARKEQPPAGPGAFAQLL
jgi:hypothetical protein